MNVHQLMELASRPFLSGMVLRGNVEILQRDRNGKLLKRRVKKNLVVTTGANLFAQLIAASGSPTGPNRIAIGTSSSSPAAGQTALQGSELARVSASKTRTNNQIQYQSTFGTGVGTGTIKEAGLFNATSAGTMAARFLTGTFVKASGTTVTVTWTLTLTPV